jgi:ATP-binding cassette, subfamily B, bacterial PglK
MLEVARKLLSFLDKKSRTHLYLLLIPMLVMALLEMVSIGMIIPFIQVVLNGSDSEVFAWLPPEFSEMPPHDFLIYMAIGFSIFFIIKNIAIFWIVYGVTNFTQRKLALFRQRLFNLYLHRSYTFHLQKNSAEIIRNLGISAGSAFDGLRLALSILMDIFLATAAMLLLLIVEPVVTISIGFVLVLAGGAIYGILGPKLQHWGEQAFQFEAKVIQAIAQGLGAFKEIKVLNSQRAIGASFGVFTDRLAYFSTLSITINQSPRLFVETIAVTGFFLLVVILLGLHDSVDQVITILAVFGMAALRLMPSMNRILSSATEMRHRTAMVDGLYQDLKDASNKIENHQGSKNLIGIPFKQNLQLVNLKYIYPASEAAAVNGISFTIEKGTSIGLVGQSGSGKTTTVDIILGLLDPMEGQLLIDGSDAFANISSWQRHLGYVPQSIYIFDDTLRRNIAFGVIDDEIDEQAVLHAIKLAKLEELADNLPDGLDTVLGEYGARLSGGQLQRVGIARALYRNPSVLIFDEATSALDNETEREVTQAIEVLSGDKTIIIIAHRLSTVENCDQIVFMKQGKVVDTGTFFDLQKRNAAFRRMVNPSDTEIMP